MARLIYGAIASLDGYVADQRGDFTWAAPDEEVHAFVNDLVRDTGTHLLGRRMYEVLVAWETMPTGPAQPAAINDFAALWRASDKVVYSRTLAAPSSARTRIERAFDPVAVRREADAAERDLAIGGAELAGQALAAGIVDELQLILVPVLVGGGTRALPEGVRLDLELLDERRFGGGAVALRHRIPRP
jgi:dihydrofolate reductase